MALNRQTAALDWPRIEAELAARGCATTGPLLPPEEVRRARRRCTTRRRASAAGRHGAARLRPGRVQVLRLPLPRRSPRCARASIRRWRRSPIAGPRRLASRAGLPGASSTPILARCHEAGQARPTPLLLRYGPGDYNCLHQDLYGELAFPLQVGDPAVRAGRDFTGGEFVLTEQRPRMQSRAEVVPLRQGEARDLRR